MEFYYTYICPKCKENRDLFGLKPGIRPQKCRVCGKKVIAVKIYMDYLEGYKKPFSFPTHFTSDLQKQDECPACKAGVPLKTIK